MQLKDNYVPVLIYGILSALLLWAASLSVASIALISSFWQIPLFMAALSLGMPGTLLASSVSIIGGGLLMLKDNLQSFGGMTALFTVTSILPALIIAHFAMLNRQKADGQVEWYPVGSVIMWLAGAVIAVTCTMTLGGFGEAGGEMQKMAQDYVQQALQMEAPEMQVTPEELSEIIGNILPMLPGVMAMMWLLASIVNALIAEGLLLRMRRAQRPMPQMSDVDLPDWTPFIVAAAGLLIAFASAPWNFVGQNILWALMVPFILAGLAVIHALTAKSANRVAILVLVYSILFFISPLTGFLPLILVAVLGLMEQFLHLRQRTARNAS